MTGPYRARRQGQRPPTGLVRMRIATLKLLDKWIDEQPDQPTIVDAIDRLLLPLLLLADVPDAPKATRKPKEVASEAIQATDISA